MKATPVELGKGAILPLLMQMSWPAMIAMFAMAVYQVVDAFWVAKLSSQALAALTLCYPIQAIILSLGIGTGVGASAYTSRMFGSGEIQKARLAAGQTISISFSLGIILIIVVYFQAESILLTFGATAETLVPAGDYLRILVFGSPFLFILFIANNLLRAEGRPKLSMYIVLMWTVMGSALAPFLIFGGTIFPPLGFKGAAVAAVSAQFVSSLFSLYLLTRKNSKFCLRRHHLYPHIAIALDTYRTGMPSMVINLIMSLMLILYNHFLAPFGPAALAIMGLCFRINSLVMMVIFALGQGLLPIVSYNHGAHLTDRIRYTVRVAVQIAAGFSSVSSLLIIIFAAPILYLFTSDPVLLTDGVMSLRIYVTMLIFAGPIFIWINAMIGMGRGSAAMLLLMLRDLLFIAPLLFLLRPWLGLHTVWLSQTIGYGAAFILIYIWMKRFLNRLPTSDDAVKKAGADV